MRTRLALALPALLLALSCKGDDGESSSSSGGEAHCSAGWGDGPEVDPDYPACGCDIQVCENGGLCRVSGFSPEWTSSLCAPACTHGPSCMDPNAACADNDCPMLGDIKPRCLESRCIALCEETPCPNGYVCGDDGTCQVQLE